MFLFPRALCQAGALVVLICATAGCASYSPVLAPPASPLPRMHGEIVGGYGAQVMSDDLVTDGIHASARFAFSDRVTLGGVVWTTNESVWDRFGIDGIAADGIVTLSDTSSATRFGLLGRYNWLFDGNTLVGLGILGGGVVWLPKFWQAHPFAALQFGYGWSTDAGYDTDIDEVLLVQEHVGASFDLWWGFQLRGELAFVQERFRRDTGRWDDRILWSFLPSASVAWTFALD